MTGGAKALAGIRVLDFTQMMMGPLCTQLLADFGADVIKIERPDGGDWMRQMPMLGQLVGGDSAAFHAFNRNKRSVALDLKNDRAREALLSLAGEMDVVAENFRSGVMDRLGLGYEAFRARNPRIVYASGSGWGAGSRLAQEGWPGQDLLVQAMSGLMFNTGRASDPPTACGTPVADFAASQSLAIGILLALLARERLGIGQLVEADLHSSLLAAMGQETFAQLNQDEALERSAAGIAACWNDAPYGAYRTEDGWIAIAMCPLPRLARALGLKEDGELARLDPWRQRDRARDCIASAVRLRATAAWMETFRDAGVWAAPVRRLREVAEELQEGGGERILEIEHPRAGRIRAVACPVRLSETPADGARPAPLLGEHTVSALTALLTPRQVGALREDGLVSEQ